MATSKRCAKLIPKFRNQPILSCIGGTKPPSCAVLDAQNALA